MGKGRLVLVPLKEPKEGMKVEYCKSIEKIESVGFVNAGLDNQVYLEEFDPEDWVDLSELQQIAIEYDGGRHKFKGDYDKQAILLSPDDYEKALPLIGQEVSWGESTEYGDWEEKNTGIPPKKSKVRFPVKVAKLVTPSPIVYTEEEAREIASMAWFNSMRYKDPFSDWWDKHKRK